MSALLALLSAGCDLFDTTCDEDDRDCLGAGIFAKGLGGECSRTADCKEGLFCIDEECQPRGDTATGDACRLTAECKKNDYCASSRACKLAGTAGLDASCFDTSECEHGLICEPPDLTQLDRLSLQALATLKSTCKEGGEKEQGAPCKRASECVAGLYCGDAGDGETRCISPPVPIPEPPAIPVLLWDGVQCEEIDEDAAPEAFFEVPGVDEDSPDEFYRLPFPNDIRVRDGRVDLSGHAVPPRDLGLPFVERYLEAVEEDADGFSTNPVAIFRFSHEYDTGDRDEGRASTVNGDTVRIVDITPDSPGYNADASLEWKTTAGPLSNYVCPHWLGLRRPPGEPLRPNTTYAAIVTTGVKPSPDASTAQSFKRGRDFSAMLENATPGDAALARAHERYAPLRDWLEETSTNPDTILVAAVFTTMDTGRMVAKLHDAVVDDGVPTVSGLIECTGAGAPESPCESVEIEQSLNEDGDIEEMRVDRGKCLAASSDFTELHGLIRLPIFQKGELPYLEPEDGGAFELGSDGTPRVQGHQEVCMAISVPKAPPPADGYPVLVYAHGTGGSFTGQLGSNGFSRVVATGDAPAVLIAIDMPMHGMRKGDSTESPDALFYNVLNPRAARDNVAQGAADLMGVVHWAKDGGLSAGQSPTGSAIPFDPARIAVFGHSQGATHYALMLSYEPDIVGAVLSGVGGHLASSLLTKSSPVDIASVLPFGLFDPDKNFELAAGGFNPALAIVQWAFDPVDSVNYARHLHREPTSAVPSGHHVFMTYGIGDTYATEETQRAYAQAARLTVVEPELSALRLPTEPAPLSGNETLDDVARTIGVRQYEPVPAGGEDVDGHFVGVRAGQPGRVDTERFVRQVLAGETPQIGE